jgi:MFS family permease
VDQTVGATALPSIVRELGTASQQSRVVTGYLLASTVATGLWGKLSDPFGRKTASLSCHSASRGSSAIHPYPRGMGCFPTLCAMVAIMSAPSPSGWVS